MPRQQRDAKLDSRSARAKLPVRHEPYWRKTGRAVHLGYRKGSTGSSWLVRAYDGTRYRKATLGTPDDLIEADGERVLTFTQAIEGALAWSKIKEAEDAAVETELPKPPLTVAKAAADYVEAYEKRSGRDLRSVESRISLHILPAFGAIEVAKLTQSTIEKWFYALADSERLYRPSLAGLKKTAPLDKSDPEAIRRRRSAANRTLTVLKAILNNAFQRNDDSVPNDRAWRTVKPFKSVDAARERSLFEPEVGALLAATSGAFRDLCLAALLTGCRYSELIEATVGAVDLKRATLYVPRSKSGHTRDVTLTEPAVKLLERLTRGRALKDRVFLKSNGEPWRASDQLRPMKKACKAAGIDPPIGFHILRHTHASELAMRGVALQVIAKQIGHRSTKTTEEHYAHLRPSYVAEQIRGALPSFQVMSDR